MQRQGAVGPKGLHAVVWLNGERHELEDAFRAPPTVDGVVRVLRGRLAAPTSLMVVDRLCILNVNESFISDVERDALKARVGMEASNGARADLRAVMAQRDAAQEALQWNESRRRAAMALLDEAARSLRALVDETEGESEARLNAIELLETVE